MINITISNEIILKGLQDSEIKALKDMLTIANPKWTIAFEMNKPLWNIPEKLIYYKIAPTGELVVPVGILDHILKIFPYAHYTDARHFDQLLDHIVFKGTLRDYQEDAVKDMMSSTNSVLSAMTGSGKTLMAIKLICELKQSTLFLVNTQELANQFVARVTQFTNLAESDIGFLGNGIKIIKPLTVGLLQTVTTMNQSDLKFGMTICDETHICAATTYAAALSRLNSRYKKGLSATPERTDGLTKVIFWLTGPLTHTVPANKLIGSLVKPSYKIIDTEYNFPLFDSSEYQEMITDLSSNNDRNDLIVKELNNYSNQQVVLLCQRLEQVYELQKRIPGSVILTSKMTKKQRDLVMLGLTNVTHRIIISTYSLFSTGIDLADLEILFMCAPIKSAVKVKQSAGRLMRKSANLPNKTPIIVDFADKKNDLLRSQWRQRSKILRNL